MTTTDADTYNRTAKILVDSGRVGDIADATRYLEGLVLQLQVGPRINESLPAQAALLTAVNAGHRALLGGVRTTVEDDPVLSLPWARKMRLSDAIREFGGEVADELAPDAPILTIGKPRRNIRGRANLNAVWRGWCGGVTEAPPADEHDHAIPLAGVLAGALGVSEIFQHLLGSATAARRDVGLSLWRPDLSWQAADAEGPELVSGPDGIWLLGLGHLGQANAWSLGCLPYQYPETADVMVVDVDDIVKANHATGLLTRHQDIGRHKTRVVASRLEALGHRCHIVERRFDNNMIPHDQEPQLALAGFHDLESRRALGDNKFARVVDAGLGAGPKSFLNMHVHAFPSQLDPQNEFSQQDTNRNAEEPLAGAYEVEVQRRIREGTEPGAARCGVIALAGVTPAAAFVGAVAGAISVAGLLRAFHSGKHYSVTAVDLRSPNDAQAVLSEAGRQLRNPGYAPLHV